MEVYMAPKVKITGEDIVKAAVELVRVRGEKAINAREIAAALNCSTQPIFTNFATCFSDKKTFLFINTARQAAQKPSLTA